MPLYDLLSKTSEDQPDGQAVICGRLHYTYADLKKRVDLLGMHLIDLGIGHGDRIAMIGQNCYRFLETYFAVAKIGAVLVPINYRFSDDDFVYTINHSGARVLISESGYFSEFMERERELPCLEHIVVYGEGNGEPLDDQEWKGNELQRYDDLVEEGVVSPSDEKSGTGKVAVSDRDIAQIYYTSGTTGRPKGVILTNRNNLAHAEGTIKELSLSDRDRWLHVSPMFHLADAWAIWSVTQVGGTHVIIPCFEPESVLETIENHGVTLSNFIPTMLNILVKHPGVRDHDFSSLRLLMSGGAPIAKDVVKKVMDVFKCDYIQTYGLTETSPFLTMSLLRDWMKELPWEEQLRYLVTTGRPFYGVELKVVKEDGTEVEADEKEVGEIIAKGETITPGYWMAPDITAERIVDGWLHTRDLAVINEEGYVTIVDRADDMIITGVENVYSVEVEDVLYSHPDVYEAAVIGLPDPVWGEKVVAVVVLKEGVNGSGSMVDEEMGERKLEQGGRKDLGDAKVVVEECTRNGIEEGEKGLGKKRMKEGGKNLSSGKDMVRKKEKDIIKFCKERIARYKAPKNVFFLGELPKTGSSKIQKNKLREMFTDRINRDVP